MSEPASHLPSLLQLSLSSPSAKIHLSAGQDGTMFLVENGVCSNMIFSSNLACDPGTKSVLKWPSTWFVPEFAGQCSKCGPTPFLSALCRGTPIRLLHLYSAVGLTWGSSGHRHGGVRFRDPYQDFALWGFICRLRLLLSKQGSSGLPTTSRHVVSITPEHAELSFWSPTRVHTRCEL